MKITKTLSLIVITAGAAVIIGWIYDIQWMKSISPAWTNMKFDTALAFIFSGLTLFFLALSLEGKVEVAQIGLTLTSLVITLLMGTIFLSSVFELRIGVEDMFVKEAPGNIKSIIPGRPSLVTAGNFLLIAAAGMLFMLKRPQVLRKIKSIGLIITLAGAIAVFGYLSGIPLLYYYVTGLNTAMALHTAVLFIILGIGFLCL